MLQTLQTLQTLLMLLTAAALLAVRPAAAATWIAGPERAPLALAEALARAADGDTIELLPGRYVEPLLIEGRRLTLRGVGAVMPQIDGGGKRRESPGLWTIRGGEVTLQNLEFRGARSIDGSGAGVRLEGGRLTVLGCSFVDNEQGLFAAHDAATQLRISGSVFAAAPKVVGGLFHLINIGRIALFEVSASRFQNGFEGHLIKSRARENRIAYNFINDGVHGAASYQIELAHGGRATVIGNVIAQGLEARNQVLLAYGSEGRVWDDNALFVAHNTFINYGWMPAWFVRVFRDKLPGAVDVHLINNLLVGPGLLWPAVEGDLRGNRYASRGMLRDIWTHGLELPPGSVWRGSGVDPRNIAGHNLAPAAEFDWPARLRELPPGRSDWTPGAFQR